MKVLSPAGPARTQSLMRASFYSLAFHQPVTAFISQHAAGHPTGYGGVLRYSVRFQMTAWRSARYLTSQDAGDVTQQVIKKRRDPLITWMKMKGHFRLQYLEILKDCESSQKGGREQKSFVDVLLYRHGTHCMYRWELSKGLSPLDTQDHHSNGPWEGQVVLKHTVSRQTQLCLQI